MPPRGARPCSLGHEGQPCRDSTGGDEHHARQDAPLAWLAPDREGVWGAGGRSSRSATRGSSPAADDGRETGNASGA
jgi:hypothetical protein